jgi:hypothetical protein
LALAAYSHGTINKNATWTKINATIQNVNPIIFLSVLAKHTEAGVLYFNNPGNRPAGLTVQVLDPGSVTSLQTVSYINNRSGLKGEVMHRH